MAKPFTWEESVLFAFGRTAKEMPLADIYDAVESVRKDMNLPLNNTWHATVRRILKQSPYLVQADTKGRGWWRVVDERTWSNLTFIAQSKKFAFLNDNAGSSRDKQS